MPTQPHIVYFSGIRGTLVQTEAQIASEFNWYWASGVLYVWTPTGGDPSSYYTAPGIEAGARNRVVDTNNQSYVTLNGLAILDANGLSDGMINIGSTSVVGVVFENLIVKGGADIAFNAKGSTLAASLTINNCIISGNGGYSISVSDQYATATLSNNTITGNGWASARDSQEYSPIGGNLGNVNIFGNSIYSNDAVCYNAGVAGNYCHGIYYGTSSSVPVNIFNNTIYSMANGSGVKAIGSANIYQNTIYGNGLNGIQLGQNGSANVQYSVHGNVIYNNNATNSTGAGISQYSQGTGTISISAYSNTLYNNGNTTGYEIQVADNVNQLTIQDNVMYASSTRRDLGIALALTGAVLIDDNLDWRADSAPSISYKGSFPTWQQWQALGFDTHSLNADPEFVSAQAANFSLAPDSPALNRGVPVAGVPAPVINLGAK